MRTLTLALAALAFAPTVNAQETEDVRNVGDWEIYTVTDPFTDSIRVHVTVAVQPYDPVGIEAVTVSCDGSDGSLWGRVFHSFMIGSGDRNRVMVRFGEAPPREMQGFTFAEQTMTQFEVHRPDLASLRTTPERLAVRFTDAGDGMAHQFAWTALAGTAEALDAIEACLGEA